MDLFPTKSGAVIAGPDYPIGNEGMCPRPPPKRGTKHGRPEGGASAPLEFAKYRNLEGYLFVTSFFYKLAV